MYTKLIRLQHNYIKDAKLSIPSMMGLEKETKEFREILRAYVDEHFDNELYILQVPLLNDVLENLEIVGILEKLDFFPIETFKAHIKGHTGAHPIG